jgi:hypothetical protein
VQCSTPSVRNKHIIYTITAATWNTGNRINNKRTIRQQNSEHFTFCHLWPDSSFIFVSSLSGLFLSGSIMFPKQEKLAFFCLCRANKMMDSLKIFEYYVFRWWSHTYTCVLCSFMFGNNSLSMRLPEIANIRKRDCRYQERGIVVSGRAVRRLRV